MSNEPISPLASEMSSSSASSEVNQLAARVTELETRLSSNSWLYSSNFFKRALALWGHVIAIQLVIAIIIWGVLLGCGVFFGGLAATLGSR